MSDTPTTSRLPTKGRKHHPASSIFPLLDGDDLDDLVEDIRSNGLRVPILVDRQGRIIDGRNRQVACLMAGVEPRYETCEVTDDAEIARLVWSLNEKRRHLTAGQRTAAALKMEEVVEQFKKEADERKAQGRKKGGKARHSGQASREAQAETCNENKTAAKVASVAGTSRATVERTKAVKERAPDLFEKIEAGELTPNAAYRQLREREEEEDDEPAREPTAGDFVFRAMTAIRRILRDTPDHLRGAFFHGLMQQIQLQESAWRKETECQT